MSNFRILNDRTRHQQTQSRRSREAQRRTATCHSLLPSTLAPRLSTLLSTRHQLPLHLHVSKCQELVRPLPRIPRKIPRHRPLDIPWARSMPLDQIRVVAIHSPYHRSHFLKNPRRSHEPRQSARLLQNLKRQLRQTPPLRYRHQRLNRHRIIVNFQHRAKI
jgi:hypothetical protein